MFFLFFCTIVTAPNVPGDLTVQQSKPWAVEKRLMMLLPFLEKKLGLVFLTYVISIFTSKRDFLCGCFLGVDGVFENTDDAILSLG